MKTCLNKLIDLPVLSDRFIAEMDRKVDKKTFNFMVKDFSEAIDFSKRGNHILSKCEVKFIIHNYLSYQCFVVSDDTFCDNKGIRRSDLFHQVLNSFNLQQIEDELLSEICIKASNEGKEMTSLSNQLRVDFIMKERPSFKSELFSYQVNRSLDSLFDVLFRLRVIEDLYKIYGFKE